MSIDTEPAVSQDNPEQLAEDPVVRFVIAAIEMEKSQLGDIVYPFLGD